jgi:hypothetical protein
LIYALGYGNVLKVAKLQQILLYMTVFQEESKLTQRQKSKEYIEGQFG